MIEKSGSHSWNLERLVRRQREAYDLGVTRDEAEAECTRLCAEHPDRLVYRWFPQECGERGWVVARVPVPPGARIDPLKATVETKPRPPTPDDPRTAFERNVGGNYLI
jgi:hypothetical protein